MKKTEKEVIKFWNKEKIAEKVRNQNRKSKKKFYFMDGPPYATGHIHMGTALNKILKDIVIRMKRMQGFDVFDKPGYDTHGLPIEFQIEKELGFQNKKDIEKFGVKKFVEKCKNYATRYINVMNSEFNDLGVWMDWKNPYLTLTKEYIEAIWWTFKKAHDKKLLYLGKYPVHVCPRCETAVAYNEIVYQKIDDTAVYVKFQLKKEKNKYLLIWTTTPWTLPGNTGIMVNPGFEYAEVQVNVEKGKEIWIMAKELIEKIMSGFGYNYKIIKTFRGKEMEGWKYFNPLIEHLKLNLNKEKNYKIVLSSRYVNLEEGTGLVHSAPGHGKEDYEVGKEYGLDMPSPVSLNGLMTEEAGKYQGKKARVVDEEIMRDLDEEGMLAHKHVYTHDYPTCWRCKEPLLMIALPQWFFKISSIHKKLLEENEKIFWQPEWMKARMKAWLEGIGDWPISRQRYWGTPLPIWICEKCKEKRIIGSVKELEKLAGKKIKELHKPEIDSVILKCKKCRGKMKRVPEVLDVWFDSGVSSWAALNYPQKKDLFKKFWPADLNIEATDQFRGWWNSQLILSVIAFNKKPYKSIMVHGMVTDIEKRKMSKSLGNIVTPQQVIEKYGRDYLRAYLSLMSRGEDFSYTEKFFKDISRFFMIFTNIENFISQLGYVKVKNVKSRKIEDKWILSRFNSVIKEVMDNYNNYLFYKALETLQDFTINDLSKTYVKLIREREDKEVAEILNYVYLNLLKLFAPFYPHLTEFLYKNFKEKLKEKSIHLANFPKPGKIDKKLEEEFEIALKVIEAGLAERDKAGIGLRWPLSKAVVYCEKKLNEELQEIILRQINVKKIELKEGKLKVELDTKLNEELEAEGYAREIARSVQAERKNAGLIKKDKIELIVVVDDELLSMLKMLRKQEKFLKERVNAKTFSLENKKRKRFKYSSEFKIKEKRVFVTFEKV